MGRITLREGALVDEPGVVRLAPALGEPVTEASLREAFAAALVRADAAAARVVAVPALGAGALPLQRCAEILLDEARRHLAAGSAIEEIRFAIEGEPAYRLFEAVQDAARIAEQMARLG